MYFITIPRESTKTHQPNCFAITGALFATVQRYASLRPTYVPHDRFFLNFQKGKCTTQPIGKNKFYKFPTRMAEYLNLPNANRYTGNICLNLKKKIIPTNYSGHSFRRSSATLLANTGASIETLKRHTGHKSTSVCESYIDDSIGYKKRTGNAIASSLNCTVTSSSAVVSSEKSPGSEVVVTYPTNDGIVDPCVAATSSVRFTQHVNPLQNGSDNYTTATPTSSSSFANVCSDDMEPNRRMVNDENIAPSCSSLTQSSTQNLMSKMEKFFFYKCDNLTINLNQKDCKKEPQPKQNVNMHSTLHNECE